MQRLLSLLLIFSSLAFKGQLLYAQSKLDSLQQLPEVEVKARFIKEAIPGQKLTGKELQKLSSFSVADAVRYFSGIQLKDYGGIGGLKTVNIRSMGTNHLGVFYDGIQLGNAQNGQIDLGKFSLDNIEQISLHNGQKSSMLQSAKDYGSAGTIYLQTKTPIFSNGKSTKLKATIKTGSSSLFAPSLLWEQKINDHLCFNFNAEAISSDGKYKFIYKRVFSDKSTAYDTTATRKNGDITAFRIESSIFGKVKNGDWDIHGYYYNSHRGLPGPIVKNVFEHGQRLNDEDYFIQGKFRKKFNRLYSLQILAKYANDYTRYIDREWTSPIYVDNQYEQKECYISAANMFETGKLRFNLAADFQWNKMDANLVNFSYPNRYTVLTAIAAEYNLPHLTLQASGLGTFVKETVEKNAAAPRKSIYTPALLFSYHPFQTKSVRIEGFYKRIFRMPTFNDLYYTFIGNAVLHPEYTTQYDLAIHLEKRRPHRIWNYSKFRVEGYINHISDKIVAVPAGNMFRWMMLNLGRVNIKGVEVNTDHAFQWNSNWLTTLRLSYTYQKAMDITDSKEKNYRHQIPYIPFHSGSVIASCSYRDYGLNYSFIYTGKRYNAKYNDANSELQPWYTSDVSLYKDFKLRRNSQLRLQLDINNLLNQHYDVVLNYPMPGRNYRFTLKFEY